MPPQQVGQSQPVQRILPQERRQASSGGATTTTTANMARWLNEKSRQEHWNAVARVHVKGSENGQVKSKI